MGTPNRFYSNTAARTSLTAGVNPSVTTLAVASATGFPGSFPFTLILERDSVNEEVVTVTAASGLNMTVTRGADGTTGVTHGIGATVEHGTSARDFAEPQSHLADTTRHLVAVDKGDILVGTGAGTTAIVEAAGADGNVLTEDHAAATGWSSKQPNMLLGVGVHVPVANGVTITSWDYIDSTNIKTTVVAPASGKLLVKVASNFSPASGATPSYINLAVGTSNTAMLANCTVWDIAGGYPGGEFDLMVEGTMVVTGLTPGTSYTLYGLRSHDTATHDGHFGQGWILVWAAP